MYKRQTVLEIDKNAFLDNIEKYIGKNVKIMPVIKANAYGTYINKDIDLIKKFDIVAVAIVQEAIELRKVGYKNDIFILNQPYKEDIDEIIKNNVTVGVSSIEFIDELAKQKNKIKVHLEIETGMGRTGININELDKFINHINNIKNICVSGVYTHLSSADSDIDYTNKQIKLFENSVKKIKKEFNDIEYVHCCASSGILNTNNKICNMVRPGILLYGYEPFKSANEKIQLKPVAKLVSEVSFLKDVKQGDSISYGRSFIAKDNMKIATVGIGYADGLRRELSNKGKVVINGKKASIVGRVCMDSIMVDVTDIKNVKIGDKVYIWDNEKITLDDVAKKCRTINYEILSTISDRVPRKFI